MVSTQKQCSKQKKQDLSEKPAAAAERAKAAGKIRLGKKQPTSAEKPLIKKIVSLFQVRNMPVPHDEFQDVMNRVLIRLGINSPLKHAKSRKHMTPLEDLHYCAGSLSWRQRCSMKAELIKLGMDVFAPSHQVTAMDVVYALKRQGRTLYGLVDESPLLSGISPSSLLLLYDPTAIVTPNALFSAFLFCE
uniref:Uncharacterized protein n=1 Tax=Ditylenchus dipsaci TaxID=166011 RepID=A0A915EFV8_9BILA